MAPTKEEWEERTDAGEGADVEPPLEEDVDEFGGGATTIAPPPTGPQPAASKPPSTPAASPRPAAKVTPIAAARDDKADKLKSLTMGGSGGGAGAGKANLSKLKSLSLDGAPAPATRPAPLQGGGSFPVGRVVTILLVAGLAAGGFIGWKRYGAQLLRPTGGGNSDEPKMRFLVTEMKTQAAGATLTASGYISAETFTIGATVSGRVENVLAKEGDFVKKKTLLIQLDDSQIKADKRLAAQKASSSCGIYAQQSRLAKVGAALPLEVAKARGECDAARAEVGTYDPKLQQMRIVAPVDATVVEVLAHAGETLTAGGTTGVIRLADLNRPLVEADINEADVPSLHIGDKVEATVESFPEVVFPGTLRSIAPEADRTKGTFKATIALVPDRRLRTNMSAKIRFQGSTNPVPKLLIPKDAVKNGAVWKVIDGRAKRTSVTAVPGGAGVVEVTSGLKPGERIIVSGFEAIADGDKVQLPGS